MGTWSKVNAPTDSESIHVEMVGVVDMAKALECNWSSRIKNVCEQYEDDRVLCKCTIALQVQRNKKIQQETHQTSCNLYLIKTKAE